MLVEGDERHGLHGKACREVLAADPAGVGRLCRRAAAAARRQSGAAGRPLVALALLGGIRR